MCFLLSNKASGIQNEYSQEGSFAPKRVISI